MHVLVLEERSWRRSLSDSRWMSSARYLGALPQNDWYTRHVSLNVTHWQTGRQCNWHRTGMMWSQCFVPVTRCPLRLSDSLYCNLCGSKIPLYCWWWYLFGKEARLPERAQAHQCWLPVQKNIIYMYKHNKHNINIICWVYPHREQLQTNKHIKHQNWLDNYNNRLSTGFYIFIEFVV